MKVNQISLLSKKNLHKFIKSQVLEFNSNCCHANLIKNILVIKYIDPFNTHKYICHISSPRKGLKYFETHAAPSITKNANYTSTIVT